MLEISSVLRPLIYHPLEGPGWLATRLNRQLLRGPSDASVWALYEGTEGRAPRSLQRAGADRVDLLVVLTTYGREASCEGTLHGLAASLDHHRMRAAAGKSPNVHLVVVHDADGQGYDSPRAAARARFAGKHTWLDARARLGKPGFWKSYQAAFLAARELQPAHALFLQDDLAFSSSLVADCYSLLDAAPRGDGKPVALHLFASPDDEPEGRWIRFHRRDVPGGKLRQTQWLDLSAFYVERSFLELLSYRVFPVHPQRWWRHPERSSGVGEQLTRRIHRRASIYQPLSPLVLHGAHASEMNPEDRRERALDNRPNDARGTAASFP